MTLLWSPPVSLSTDEQWLIGKCKKARLFVFLRDVPTTLLVSLAVPSSLVVTLAAMYFTGLTLNVLTMMGMMLSVGMLVDNAVVVTESIFRHRLRNPDKIRLLSTLIPLRLLRSLINQ